MVIDVYMQYFRAEAVFNEIPRRAAVVRLTSDSEEGNIRYTVSVNFFPFRDEEDFLISSDAYFEREIFNAKGRRSKKREAVFMGVLHTIANEIAAEHGGKILWDEPILDPVYG